MKTPYMRLFIETAYTKIDYMKTECTKKAYTKTTYENRL